VVATQTDLAGKSLFCGQKWGGNVLNRETKLALFKHTF